MRRLLLALLLVLWAGAGAAQVVTDAAGLREIGARLLAAGDAPRARQMAEALLARDGADVEALLLLARASLAAGDPGAALAPARRAHALAPRGPLRHAAARVAAGAHAELGEELRAQLWLRRALGDAPGAEAAARVARDYRALGARSPLAVSLSFGLSPSSNVNGGSAAETIELPGLPFEFVLDPEARALSGLEVEAGLRLSWRLRGGPRSATTVEALAEGRTFLLSDAARARAPEARGSDYADGVASVGLSHRWRGEGASGPAGASLSGGQAWRDGGPFLRFGQATLERSFAAGARGRLDAAGFVERTERLREGVGYWSVGARARWSRPWGPGRAFVTAQARDALTDLADVGYLGAGLGTGFDLARPVAGLRLGVSAELDWRRFERSRYALGTRRDLRGTLRLTAGLPRLAVWGFEPTVGIKAEATRSDVDLFNSRALSLEVGFRSRL